MSAKQKESLAKYLIIGGALSFAYLMVNYFSKGPSGRKNLKIAEIHKVLKEIKYQVYANCISFSEGIKATIANKSSKPLPQEVEQKLRGQLVKTYDAKENLILKKYDISKEDFANALNVYKNDKVVKADQAEIVRVMEETLKGEIDISTPRQVQRLRSFPEIIKLHHDLCLQIGIKVWEKLDHHRRNNPNFDSKNDEDFRSAIRQLNIYDFKVGYLKNIGYREEWGCPNLNLLKLVQAAKRGNPQYKIQAICIEKAYQTVIAKVSNEPESYSRGKVEDLFEQVRSETKKALSPQPQVRSEPINNSSFRAAPSASQIPVVKSKPAPLVQPKKEEQQQFDMEKLMMEQLLNRSQEGPKPERKIDQKYQIIQEERPSSATRKIEVVEKIPESAPIEQERPRSALRTVIVEKEKISEEQQRPRSALKNVEDEKEKIPEEQERPRSALRNVKVEEEKISGEQERPRSALRNVKVEEERPRSSLRKTEVEGEKIPEPAPLEEERPSSASKKAEVQKNERPSSALRQQANNKQHGKSEEVAKVVEQEHVGLQNQNIVDHEAVPAVEVQPSSVIEQVVQEQPIVVEAKIQKAAQASQEQHIKQQTKQEVEQKLEVESHEEKIKRQNQEPRQ